MQLIGLYSWKAHESTVKTKFSYNQQGNSERQQGTKLNSNINNSKNTINNNTVYTQTVKCTKDSIYNSDVNDVIPRKKLNKNFTDQNKENFKIDLKDITEYLNKWKSMLRWGGSKSSRCQASLLISCSLT